jgi:tRNA A-37 threonylcarbamoyl transferase component Bud32
VSSNTEALSPQARRFQEVVAAYLAANEQGQAPERAALLADRPDLAEELNAFFADHDRARQATGPMQALAAPGAPRVFGDYELLGEIARGGMGVVYKARQISLNRLVALKMIRQAGLTSEGEVRRFRTEAEAAAGLDHPNIVPVYEVGEHQGQHFFSMKLMQGGSLAGRVPELVRDSRAAAQLLAIVARAVHHAHQRRLLHRDLKPANVLLDEEGRPHVTDFGVAKVVEWDSRLTRQGQVLGTPSYMAPEQAAGDNQGLTTAADVYSLGAILYELLVGRPPFQADSVLETLRRVREEEPVRPRALNPAVDRDLETVCLKCLERAPARRYGSAEALADDLERWLRGEPVVARPVGALERAVKWVKRRPARAAALAVGVLLLLGGGCFLAAVWAGSKEVALRAAQEELKRFRDEEGRRRAAPARLGRQLARVAVLWEQHPEQALSLLEDAEECPPDLRNAAWHGYHRLCKFDRRKLGQGGKPVVHVAGPADGKVLLALSADGTAKLWDVVTGKEVDTLEAKVPYDPSKNVRPLAMSPDGRRAVLVRGKDGVLVDYDVVAGVSDENEGGYIGAPAFTADGKYLAVLVSSWEEGRATEVELAEQVPGGSHRRLRLEGVGEPIGALALAPDGKALAAVTKGGRVQLWDVVHDRLRAELEGALGVSFGRLRAELEGAPGVSFGLAFAPDGTALALRCDQPPDHQGKPQPPQVKLLDVPP